MDQGQAKRILEALLFVFGQPLAHKRIAEVVPELGPADIRQTIQTLNAEYASSGRAFLVQEVAGGYQIVTDQQLAPWVRRALQSPKPDAVSAAALETLAIIAYRQPITKAEIEAIRGVDVTASLDTLLERRFVRAAGRKESPGRPFLYGTTTEFLRHFGLKSLEALPSIRLPAVSEPAAERPAPAEPAPGASDAAMPSDPDAPAPSAAAMQTREDLAKAARLSSSQVVLIEKIQKQATPELVAAVKSGTISINAAAAVSTLPQQEQVEAALGGKEQLLQAAKRVRETKKRGRPDEASAPEHDTVAALKRRIVELEAENKTLREQLEAVGA